MNEFAKTEKVVYVNPRIEIREVFRLLCKPRNWFKDCLGVNKVNNNLLLIESVWLFPKIYKFKFLDNILNRLYHFFVQLIAALWGKKCSKVLYIWEPDFADFLKYYPDVPFVYHPYDLFEKYVAVSSRQVNEVELARNAVAFYTVSNLLCEHYKEKVGRKPDLILNGVDEVYFRKEVNDDLQLKANNILSKFKSKKIAYFGSIKGILNLDLVISTADRLIEYDIFFIGELRYLNIPKYDAKVEQIFALKNVHHIGPFDVNFLSYLLQQMDILILLYSQDPRKWTYYGGPAKLFECMALGRPIIATPHPALSNFHKYIKIVGTADEFIDAVNGINDFWTSELLNEMIEVAKKNTWAGRKEKILKDLGSLE